MTSITLSHTGTNTSQHSLNAPTLPPYTEHPVELTDLTITSSTTSKSTTSLNNNNNNTESGPSSSTHSHTTLHLQIQTEGKPWLSLPTPPRNNPLPIFALTPDNRLDRPLYLSLRPTRRSGSCYLVQADDETQTPLTRTRYGFGPFQPPRVSVDDEEFEMVKARLMSRSQRVRMRDGTTLEWRYAGSAERRREGVAEGNGSLLVLERVWEEDDQRREKVAQLVRSDGFRSPGSGRSTAGNGGRLMVDLRGFGEKKRERVQLTVVTTAIAMLKKEVDRRRACQIAAMSGAAGS